MTGFNDGPPARRLWELWLWRCEAVAQTRVRLHCGGALILERQVHGPEDLSRVADDWREAVIAHHERLLDLLGGD